MKTICVEAIKQFNEESMLSVKSNTFTSNDNSIINAVNLQPKNSTWSITYHQDRESKYKIASRMLNIEPNKLIMIEFSDVS